MQQWSEYKNAVGVESSIAKEIHTAATSQATGSQPGQDAMKLYVDGAIDKGKKGRLVVVWNGAEKLVTT